MIEFEKPNIECLEVDNTNNYAKFVCEPLERGYGQTLGNSLRRVLLSSLPGAAAVAVSINGVEHEFSTVPGVREDVTEIVLNVKGITAKLHCTGPKTVFIDVVGEHEVTAGDIKQDSDIEILNPEHHIATVGENERFYMELTFAAGRGYVSQERNKQLHTQILGTAASAPIGTIFTDSIYTPVYNVNYAVENTRVGSRTDYDKLSLEVLTNGTISAKEAISLGAKILNEHLNLFIDLSDEAKKAEIMVEREETIKEKVLEMTIEELDMSVRSFNCLKRAGIDTVEDLTSAFNHMRRTLNFPELSRAIVEKMIGNGMRDVILQSFAGMNVSTIMMTKQNPNNLFIVCFIDILLKTFFLLTIYI